MNKLFLAFSLVLLSGCAQITGLVPSFWDDNQSAKIVDIRLSAERIDCNRAQALQVSGLRDQLEWFRLYGISKGSRQQDVLRLTEPMQATVEDWYKRVSAEGYKENPVYCRLKRDVVVQQSKRAAEAVLGRF